MDDGKQQALFEFSYLAAKEGGYAKERVTEFHNLSKEYFIPMISALLDEKLVSNENEFDEAMFVLEQYSPQVVKAQMKVEEAKNGDIIEIMKFFAALIYEFRVRCPSIFTRLCKSMSGQSQHNIAHFISYMDHATTDEESDWCNILFTPYSSDDLKRLGAVKTANSIKTPCKTPKRSLLPDNSIFDNPVDIVINSPTGKDRLIKEYERRLKSEREVARTLQAHCEETFDENAKLKVEVGSLKQKLRRTSTNFISACGDECQNKNELASMKVLMTVRENKVYQLTEELEIAQEELELANEALAKSELKNRELAERNEFLSTEIERLHYVSNELNETRQKLSAAIKEKEDLWIKGSLNADLTAKTQQLTNENDQLQKQNEELTGRLASMEKLVNELRSNLNIKEKSLSDLSNKLDVLAKVKKEPIDDQELHDELQADETLKSEIKRLQDKLENEKRRFDEAEKKYGERCEILKQMHTDELKHVKRMRSGRSKVKPTVKSTFSMKDQKSKLSKSSVSSRQAASAPQAGDSNLNVMHGPPLKPKTRKTTLGRKIVYIFKKVSCSS